VEPAPLADALAASSARLDLPLNAEVSLCTRLALTKRAFEQDHPRLAANRVKACTGEIEAQRGRTLTAQQSDLLIRQATRLIDCVFA